MRTRHFSSRTGPAGFSLVELLAVIAIIALLAVLVTPAINSISSGTSLTVSAATVTDTLNLARQTALSKNRPVEVRFLKVPAVNRTVADGAGNFVYRAIALYQISDADPMELSRIIYLQPNIQLADSDTFGTLIKYLPVSTMPVRAIDPSGTTFSYSYFQFRPDGSTNLSPQAPTASGDAWHMMIYSANSPPQGSTPPKNYITLQLDPLTGRTRTFQP